MGDIVVISLGGSVMVPGEIDVEFLKGFRKLVLRHAGKGKRFILISGGGKTCRKYQKAASEIVSIGDDDMDWLGIHATRLNAHLLRTIFRGDAKREIVKNPGRKVEFRERILIAAGWKPGWSTDYDAVLLAKQFGVSTIINLSNVYYVHDRDPAKHRDARIIKGISWRDFRKLVGDRWDPGSNKPFDPVASMEAERLGMKVIVTRGDDLGNLDSLLSGRGFKGTVIG
jgi:uridylate kinase